MPPKKAGGKASKAQIEAKKKNVEDKTFGLKNKNKSSKVQNYVKGLHQQVQASAMQQKKNDPDQLRKEKKAAELARQKEMAELFASTIKQPKVPFGVDPKSILCEFFRAGSCTKGFKCKFSHDKGVERKGPKIDVFADQRGDGGDGEDNMDDWDQDKLEKVVAQKHALDLNRPTDIICKFFLDAVENRKYGWFWQCPNGKECKYRHALPPGYVLKSQMKELLAAEAENVKDMAEIIEEERAKVDAKTPITEPVFRKWHAARQEAKRQAQEEMLEERRRKGILSGREVFEQEGFVAQDDASAADAYEREVDEDAAIREMDAKAKRALEQAAAAGRPDGSAAAAAGASSSAGVGSSSTAAAAGPSTDAGPSGSGLGLSNREEEELFGDDDDDDEDDDDDLLDELETSLKQKAAVS